MAWASTRPAATHLAMPARTSECHPAYTQSADSSSRLAAYLTRMPAGRMKSKNISSKHSNVATYPRQPANTVRVARTWRRAFCVWGCKLRACHSTHSSANTNNSSTPASWVAPPRFPSAQPCRVDAKRRGWHAEEPDGGNIVAAFHQGKAHTHRDGRPRLRQYNCK